MALQCQPAQRSGYEHLHILKERGGRRERMYSQLRLQRITSPLFLSLAHTHVHAHTHTHARTHMHAHTHTHTRIHTHLEESKGLAGEGGRG